MSDSPFMALVRRRESCRSYDPARAVGDAEVASLVEAARLAPSASNSQPWRFVAVRDPDTRARLCRDGLGGVVSNRFAAEAPLLIVLCADMGFHYARVGEALKRVSYHQMDCAMAGEHMVLRAAEMGLGTCWLGWFKARPIKRILGIPPLVKVLALITMGYPKTVGEARKKRRRPPADILHADRWGGPFRGA